MKSMIKPKEKEVFSDRTRKTFGIVRNKESLQNPVEASLAFSSGEVAKELLNYKRQADLKRDKAILQSRCLTRLL